MTAPSSDEKLPRVPATARWRPPARRVLALAVLTVALPALAYVLPQGAILRRMVEKRDALQLSGIKVEGTLTLSGEALQRAAGPLSLPTERNEAQTEASVLLKLPGRCRLEAGGAQETRLVAVQNGGRRKSAGVELPSLSRGLAEVCALLAWRASDEQEARAELEQHLRALGVEARTSSLGRFGGKVAYVLGGTKEGAAQLWVYKDSFQPARLRWKEKDGTSWDVWMVDYGSPAGGDAFPRVLEVHRNGERQLRFDALRSDTRARMEDTLFAVQ